MHSAFKISKPGKPILGTVFSGVVVTVGDKVSKFKGCDKVFGISGFNFGTNLKYITINQTAT